MKNLEEKLDISFLKKATDSFKEALDQYKIDKENKFIVDACIQRFEYCYSLSTKMIKRYLKITSDTPEEIEAMGFQNLIRKAYSKKMLINSWDKWSEYRDNRNYTSHAYNEKKAIKLVDGLDSFYNEVYHIYNFLKNSNET
ncbi:MAG: nucleotidyltransferase [Bdellovibrionales bacterium]|nr:nucleotidyltransferase [Bdellovibrionales bacterium]